MEALFAVMNTTWMKPEKNSDLYKIWTHDLHKTGAVLYQLCNIQDINHAYWKTGPAWLNGG